MTIHNELFSSQDTLLRTASINDTPPPKDSPDPIALDHVFLHDLGELEVNEVYEPSAGILLEASLNDDLDISEQVEVAFEAQMIADEKRRSKEARKNRSKKEKRRDAQRARQRQLDLPKNHSGYSRKKKTKWVAKPIPVAWEQLAKSPRWSKLKKFQQAMLKLGFPNRYFRLSYAEIAKALGCTKRHARRTMKKWEKDGFIEKEGSFLERRGKKVPIHARNYYVFTDKGKELIDEWILFLFPDGQKRTPPKDYSSSRRVGQGNATSPESEKKIFEGEDFHRHLEKVFDEHKANEIQLSPEKRAIFELMGFSNYLEKFSSILKKKTNEMPLKEVVKRATLLEKKVKKGFKIRSVGFFYYWLVQHKDTPVKWMTKKANDFMTAIEGKISMQGVDSSAVVENIKYLEKETGLKAKKKDITSLIHLGTQHLRSYLDFVIFKSKRNKIHNWIGYVISLKKKSMMEISNMYKSEEQIRKERAFEDQEIRRQNYMDDAKDWDLFYQGCAEDEMVAVCTGTGKEIWD